MESSLFRSQQRKGKSRSIDHISSFKFRTIYTITIKMNKSFNQKFSDFEDNNSLIFMQINTSFTQRSFNVSWYFSRYVSGKRKYTRCYCCKSIKCTKLHELIIIHAWLFLCEWLEYLSKSISQHQFHIFWFPIHTIGMMSSRVSSYK